MGLSDIDLSAFTNLATLISEQNNFTSIDLSKNINLVAVDFSYNFLNEIDVTNNPNIKHLYINNNKINSLNGVSSLKNIERLYAESNKISNIDLTNSKVLAKLNLSNNCITNINLPDSPTLLYGNISNQKINAESIFSSSVAFYKNKVNLNGNLVDPIQISHRGEYHSPYIEWSKLPSKNLSTYYKFSGSVNNIVFDGQVNINLIYQQQENIIPDKELMFIINEILGIRLDTPISKQDLASITEINAANIAVESLEGLQYAVNLEYLNLNNNNIQTADFSQNSLLKYIDLSNNKLSSFNLNFNNNVELSNVDLSYNNLTEININHNVNINKLNLKNNLLSYKGYRTGVLNVKDLDLSNNLFETINLANEQKLANVKITDNPNLTNISFSKLNANLTNLDISNNFIVEFTLNNAPNLSILNVTNNNLNSIDLTNFKNLNQFFADFNKINDILFSNNVNLQTLSLEANSISKLDNLLNLSNLQTLNLKNNKLTKVDISNLVNLLEVDLSENSILDLTTQNLPNLTYFNISGQVLEFNAQVKDGGIVFETPILLNKKLVVPSSISNNGKYQEPFIKWVNISSTINTVSYNFD